MQDLISKIVTEVLQQLSGGVSRGDRVMVLAERSTKVEEEVRTRLGHDIELCFYTEGSAACTAQRYIVPCLSCTATADLATGRAYDPLTQKILHLLLSGSEVEVFSFEHEEYANSARGSLYLLYEEYKERLSSFGLKEFREKLSGSVRIWENVLSEKDILEAQERHVTSIEIPAQAIVTPLAADLAKQAGISVLKRL